MVLRHTPNGTPYIGPPYTWAERRAEEDRERDAMNNPRPMTMLPGRVRTAAAAARKPPASDATNSASNPTPAAAGSVPSKEDPPSA